MLILILYGSSDGQTKKIAETIAGFIQKNHQVELIADQSALKDFSADRFDAVIIGGSIRMGRYPSIVRKFVANNTDWLNSLPSAFFTVCMAINSQRAESREEAENYSKNFIQVAGWKPPLVETFAGAVKYTRYNFITRFIMKRISGREGGSTDTTRDHEYTDWKAVEEFAEQFLALLGKLNKSSMTDQSTQKTVRNGF